MENMETSSEPKGSFKQARISLRFDVADSRYTVTGAEEERPEKQSLLGELIKEDIEKISKRKPGSRKNENIWPERLRDKMA